MNGMPLTPESPDPGDSSPTPERPEVLARKAAEEEARLAALASLRENLDEPFAEYLTRLSGRTDMQPGSLGYWNAMCSAIRRALGVEHHRTSVSSVSAAEGVVPRNKPVAVVLGMASNVHSGDLVVPVGLGLSDQLGLASLSSLRWAEIERFRTSVGIVGEFSLAPPEGTQALNGLHLVLSTDAKIETLDRARALENLVQPRRERGYLSPVQNIPSECTSLFAMQLAAAAATSHFAGDVGVQTRTGVELDASPGRFIDFGLSWLQIGNAGRPHQIAFVLLQLPEVNGQTVTGAVTFEKTYQIQLGFTQWGLGTPKILAVSTEPCRLAA
ncbi:MAG: hypothetical protein K1X79_01095 [Oligoflexia bacterium]|nr:hypothetical protein [Oligoflexia bacterium]